MKKFSILKLVLVFLLIFLSIVSLSIGAADIPIYKIFHSDKNGEMLSQILFMYRLPKLLTSILTGISLSLSGWVLQEYFKNPLAGPSVLGVTSFAGLGVAFFIILSASVGFSITNPLLIIFSALIGGLFSTSIIVWFSRKLRSTVSLIIMGFLFSAFAGAVISILQFYAKNQSLKSYIIWSFGALSGLTYLQIFYYFCAILLGVGMILKFIPDLEKLQLGEMYGQSMGVDVIKLRLRLIISASLLASVSTALVGPIAFIGLAVPHFCRSVLNTSNFYKLFYFIVLVGANLLVLFSIISEIFPTGVLPINVISSLFGVPLVLWILWKKRNENFF